MNRRKFLQAAALACAAPAAALAGDIVLYEKQSPYNTIVVTEGEPGVRTLRFSTGGARQSVVKLNDPDYLELAYTRVALTGLALCETPQRILVVGLGGGTLPAFLRKHYPDATIDAVDIDPDVVKVAKEYFGFREDDRMRAHAADGREFIEKTERPYDVIFLDAFGTSNVPPRLTTLEFLKAVRRAIKPSGVVIGNIWDRYSNPLYDSMTRTYREAFDQLLVVNVRDAGNKILLALPRREPVQQAGFARLARRMSTAGRFPFDAGEIVEYGYEPAVDNGQGRVLIDANIAEPG